MIRLVLIVEELHSVINQLHVVQGKGLDVDVPCHEVPLYHSPNPERDVALFDHPSTYELIEVLGVWVGLILSTFSFFLFATYFLKLARNLAFA